MNQNLNTAVDVVCRLTVNHMVEGKSERVAFSWSEGSDAQLSAIANSF